ncbi:protein of unknown function [Tenacibaculum aestuariivivum]
MLNLKILKAKIGKPFLKLDSRHAEFISASHTAKNCGKSA